MTNIILSKDGNKADTIQYCLTKLIVSIFFPWTCIIFLITSKNRRKLIIILLVLHWLLRCIGDMFESSLGIYPKNIDKWPYGNEQWLKSYGIASIFWHLSEIIGDWYLLIRTKVIVRDKKQLRWVFITCGLYNIVKSLQMYTFLSYVPFRTGYNYENPNQDDIYVLDMAENKFMKWSNVAFQQLCSLAYDISVIIALKRNVFNNKESLNLVDSNGNSFLRKFKQISEYRIYLSILVTMCGIPLIFMYSLRVMYCRNSSIALKDYERLEIVGKFMDDQSIDSIRVLVLNFNYIFMYVDQFLLRYYVENNDQSTYNYSNSHSTPKSPLDYNLVYHNTSNNEYNTKNIINTNLNSNPQYYNVVFN
ncbi:hypothetical protein BCR36DRAFT_17967 [Piromyces finnis]|uniref:Uncharacterized protein n=1 Tax=Piromyces finnis TaxID=1754191 RepID=A0A1Y1VFQ4_9FUNG|nr:hypothetical protein BCR36DRAFT_17967 [Piromyces finnis]|eukprot:ORX54323.1 hypothetical protein BCR36DRAFT_17967 [Piromyces finnis]